MVPGILFESATTLFKKKFRLTSSLAVLIKHVSLVMNAAGYCVSAGRVSQPGGPRPSHGGGQSDPKLNMSHL